MSLGDPRILDHTLSKPERRVLDAFAESVKTQFGETLERVAVFGSRARGDTHTGSDIDVVVIVRLPVARETAADVIVRRLLDEAWRLVPDHYVPISLLVLAYDRFAGTLARERRFATDIEREGIRL